MRTRQPKPRTAEQIAKEFIRAHLGRNAFAPFTGTDWRAWRAFINLLELWGVSRDPNSVDAMRATLACAQISVMDLFVQSIPAMLDWCHVAELWPQIAPFAALGKCAIDTSDERRYGIEWPTS